MKYRGREIDPIALWSEYVEFPPNLDTSGPFLLLVRCPNPNHDTLKKHFQINASEPLVHCFAGCGISGTYEHAIMLIEGVSRAEARKRILKHGREISGRTSDQDRKQRRQPQSVEVVQPDLSTYSYLPQIALEYLASRGISAPSISRWELGWNPETKRIVIPVRDGRKRLLFVIERAVREKDWPKYLYPKDAEKTSLLFGACEVDLGMINSFGVVLVEGSLDTIRLHQHGVSTAVGILGAYLSDRQAEIIMRMRPKLVYTFFDYDGSGANSTMQVRKKITRIPIWVCQYAKGGPTDPASMSRKEVERAVEKAIPYTKFITRVQRKLKEAV
jgi:DNA primase